MARKKITRIVRERKTIGRYYTVAVRFKRSGAKQMTAYSNVGKASDARLTRLIGSRLKMTGFRVSNKRGKFEYAPK